LSDLLADARAGDLVLLPTGAPHTIRHGKRLPVRRLAPTDLTNDPTTDPADIRWVTGTFSLEDSPVLQMLNGLPPLIELRGDVATRFSWLDVKPMCFATDWTSPSQGLAEILSRPCELLFVYALRQWAERPDAAPGWLTGAMDPVIGEAITAIHAEPTPRGYGMSPSRWQNRAGSLVLSDPGQPGPPGDSRRSGTNHKRATPT
jgi:hypothetical protein